MEIDIFVEIGKWMKKNPNANKDTLEAFILLCVESHPRQIAQAITNEIFAKELIIKRVFNNV